jgi:hypothetical protein
MLERFNYFTYQKYIYTLAQRADVFEFFRPRDKLPRIHRAADPGKEAESRTSRTILYHDHL